MNNRFKVYLQSPLRKYLVLINTQEHKQIALIGRDYPRAKETLRIYAEYLNAEFIRNPIIQLDYFVSEGRFPQERKMLPAPNPLTVYSQRPLGRMAAPIPQHRRPKGYILDRNYARPSDLIF